MILSTFSLKKQIPSSLIRLIVCLSILVCSVCYASGKKGELTGSITFKVIRFDPADHAPPEFRIGSRDDGSLIKVPLSHIAGPFKAKLRDGIHLDFWADTGEKPEVSVKIAENEREGLLLIFVPEKSGEFSILKLNALNQKINGGDRYIINVTESLLTIKLTGMNPITIEPRKGKVLHAPPSKEVASVQIEQKQNNTWKLIASEDWYFDRRFRKFLFIYRSSKSKGLLFHGVSERL